MDSTSLDFVQSVIHGETNYREQQKELIEKALEITNNNPLNALQYIVSCLMHEGHEVEFEYEIMVNCVIESSTIKLPIAETEPKDPLGFYVVWGDGSITHNERHHEYKHTLNPVIYKIRFFGFGITKFGENGPGYCNITRILSFGNLGHTFTSLEYACARCYMLSSVPPTLPPTVTNLSTMFSGCNNFNDPSITTWDTSNVTNMKLMFNNCDNFNQPLNSWNVSKVKIMTLMFRECRLFNQPLDAWDVSNVANMNNMFIECVNFNQPLNSWYISKACQDVNNFSMFLNCGIKSKNKPAVRTDKKNLVINEIF
jgi:surface protein